MPIIQPSILQIAATSAIGWLIWNLIKSYLTSSPLDKIPGPPPTSKLKGNIEQLFDRHGWAFHDELREKYGSVVRLSGLFGKPILFVYDPKALHTVYVKDSYKFDVGSNLAMLLGPAIISVRGEQHKRQRKMLSPVFSAKHMRGMTPLFYQVSRKVIEGIETEVQDGTADVDVYAWLNRTALELIGQGGLGYSLDPLLGGKPSPIGDAIKAIVPAMESLGWLQLFGPLVKQMTTPSLRQRLARWVPLKNLHEAIQVGETIDSYARDIFESKKQALLAGDDVVTNQVQEAKDLMSILLKANLEAAESDRLPDDEVFGQIALLVAAATDTTSNSLTQILLVLSKHQDAQDKLRAEIAEAIRQNGGDSDLPYDVVVNLPYMDAICRETLRLYAPVVSIYHEAYEDGVLPLDKPLQCTDGTTVTDIIVPKGTVILAGLEACNLNKDLWGEDVHEWKPERWLSPLPQNVTDARVPGVYSNLMTFGGGGRSCIGFKFAQLEMKVVLSVLIPAFKFSPADNDDDITWNIGMVRYPTVGRDNNVASCPMKMTRIRGGA
ncbi:cytochrome P450 [Panus rudis PR-1116 ss-1]|nr:cytochrome P450 [Panus rudis PR-1116 ss-1]